MVVRKRSELRKLFDSVERVEMPLIVAKNLSEIAKISVHVDRELAGFLYGNVVPPAYDTYGIGIVYEKSGEGNTPVDRTKKLVRDLGNKNKEYEFILCHTHPNGRIKPSDNDLETAKVGDIEVIARCSSVEEGFWKFKKTIGVTKSSLMAYRVCKDDDGLYYQKIPIQVNSLF